MIDPRDSIGIDIIRMDSVTTKCKTMLATRPATNWPRDKFRPDLSGVNSYLRPKWISWKHGLRLSNLDLFQMLR